MSPGCAANAVCMSLKSGPDAHQNRSVEYISIIDLLQTGRHDLYFLCRGSGLFLFLNQF